MKNQQVIRMKGSSHSKTIQNRIFASTESSLSSLLHLFLLQIIDIILVSYKLYLFGQLAGLVWRVDDLVIKNGEVESKTEPDGVCRLHFWLCYVKCFLICFLWILDYRCNANREIQITIPPNLFARAWPLSLFCRDTYVKGIINRNKVERGKEHEQPFRVIFHARHLQNSVVTVFVNVCTIRSWKQKEPPEHEYREQKCLFFPFP